jgi:hypothetical protein
MPKIGAMAQQKAMIVSSSSTPAGSFLNHQHGTKDPTVRLITLLTCAAIAHHRIILDGAGAFFSLVATWPPRLG